MCKYNHELCQYDLRDKTKHEINQHYFEFIRNATREEREEHGWNNRNTKGLYKCKICGEEVFIRKSHFKDRLQTCINGCNGCGLYGDRTIVGYNDLATVFPQISKEWHPTKNGNLIPQMFTKCSGKKVWWQCEEGHEWDSSISNRTNMKSGCPYCTNKKILKGCNDVATTDPDSIQYFANPKDAYTHTRGSQDEVDMICPHCGKKRKFSINRLTSRGFSCEFCGDGMPYPEKLMALVLKALGIDFTRQLTYDNGKHKYDFYIALWKAIFETNGIQHYKGWNNSEEDLIRQQNNDSYKRNDAINNHGILKENYNVVDCRYSTLEWCRPNIEKALSKYVDVSILTDKDWQEFDIQAQGSLRVDICKRWEEQKENNKDLTTIDVAKQFNIHYSTIVRYLTWGNSNGLCGYDGDKERQNRYKRCSIFVYLVKPNGEKWFEEPMSQKELVRQSGINEKTIRVIRQDGKPLKYSGHAKYDPKYIGSYIMTVEDYNLKYGSN